MSEGNKSFEPSKKDHFLNAKKYSEALTPKSEIEKQLWLEIENAEEPIRNILKRINRISLEKFPEEKLITEQSCTGHVTEKGELEKEKWDASMFVVIDEENPQEDVYRDLNPGITFHSMGVNENTDNSQNTLEKSTTFFKDIFLSAIHTTNKKLGGDAIKLEHSFDGYIVFEFHIQQKHNAHGILKSFWSNLEDKLSELDNIKYKTNFDKANFLRDSWSRDMQ